MPPRILLVGLILLVVTSALAQSGVNEIGVFTVPNPDVTDPDPAQARLDPDYPFGQYVVYVVFMNPWNLDLAEPMTALGGFQFRADWPPQWLVTVSLASAGWVNTANYPDVEVRGSLGVNPYYARVLMTLTIGVPGFDPDPMYFYIRPTSDTDAHWIPGRCAVFDYWDDNSPQEAFPVSGSYDAPVFACNADVVSELPTAWGGMKALFR